ncbi:MAG: hypothetical protein ACR2PG_00705 [Hyphomicrobiaceae bacterium]
MPSGHQNRRNASFELPGSGINEETRTAMNAAFDALSNWRDDVASAADSHSADVFDKMAVAAKAMGWPSQLVDTTRLQMQKATDLQLQMMDQVMDVWEQQIKDPNRTFTALESWKSGFPSLKHPSTDIGSSSRNFPGFEPAEMFANPFQFWMQSAEFWQKNWQNALSNWADMQQPTSRR